MEKLSIKMQKMILWITSYASIIALVLCGGYILRFGEDESVKKTAIHAFIVNATFIVINSMLIPLISLIMGEVFSFRIEELFDPSYGSVVIFLFFIKIVIYLVAIIKTLCTKEKSAEES